MVPRATSAGCDEEGADEGQSNAEGENDRPRVPRRARTSEAQRRGVEVLLSVVRHGQAGICDVQPCAIEATFIDQTREPLCPPLTSGDSAGLQCAACGRGSQSTKS